MEIQNLSGKEVDSNSNKISEKQDIPKKVISVYNKIQRLEHSCYTRTQFESDFFDYTWEIDDFKSVHKSLNDLSSPKFPETEYQIKMQFYDTSMTKIRFHFITEPLRGSCSIRIQEDHVEPISFIPSYQQNKVQSKTFKCDTNVTTYSCDLDLLTSYIPEKLTIYCSIQSIRQIVNNTIHTPFSTNLKIKERFFSICDSNSKFNDTKLIKFIINGESHSVPTYILCATNSSYFKDLCEKNVKEDMTNERQVRIQNNADSFKIMLMYINTGVIKQNMHPTEYELLLKTAHEYDVQHLKWICEQHLLHYVTKETAVQYIKLAWSCDTKYLADRVANIIKLHHDTIVPSEDFQLLLQENFNNIRELFKKHKII